MKIYHTAISTLCAMLICSCNGTSSNEANIIIVLENRLESIPDPFLFKNRDYEHVINSVILSQIENPNDSHDQIAANALRAKFCIDSNDEDDKKLDAIIYSLIPISLKSVDVLKKLNWSCIPIGGSDGGVANPIDRKKLSLIINGLPTGFRYVNIAAHLNKEPQYICISPKTTEMRKYDIHIDQERVMLAF